MEERWLSDPSSGAVIDRRHHLQSDMNYSWAVLAYIESVLAALHCSGVMLLGRDEAADGVCINITFQGLFFMVMGFMR